MSPLPDALSLSSLTTSIPSLALSLSSLALSIFWLALVSIPVPQPPSHGLGGAPLGAANAATLTGFKTSWPATLHPQRPRSSFALPRTGTGIKTR